MLFELRFAPFGGFKRCPLVRGKSINRNDIKFQQRTDVVGVDFYLIGTGTVHLSSVNASSNFDGQGMGDRNNENARSNNPYTPEGRQKAAQKKLEQRTLNIMMDSARTLGAKASAKKQRALQKQAQSAAMSTDFAPAQNAARGNFQQTTLQVYEKMLTILRREVGFKESGAHEFFGEWPAQFHPQMDPSADPCSFYKRIIGPKLGPLTAEDFACRPIMFWAPELQFPDFYPDKKPCCPFHPGETSCVIHNGWSNYYRRVYDENGVAALTGREYICKRQQQLKQQSRSSKKGETQCLFNSFDAAVVSQAPAYVQSYWRQHGYRLSKRSGIRWTLISQMRAQLAHGMSALGFVDALDERYHQSHAALSKMWRSYCSLYFKHQDAARAIPSRSLYFPFDDPKAEVSVPSLGFLLKTIIEEIESYIPFYKHKMSMNGGLFLSGDHFIKIGKVVLIDNERGFVGLYSVMNDFGKILLWRFVTGTTLLEVEDALRGLNRRYNLHGFRGPIIFTTDRCCQERSFYEGTNNRGQSPIFHSFVPETPGQQNDEGTSRRQEDSSGVVTKYLTLNKPPQRFSTDEVANATANGIIAQCEAKNWTVVSLDSEWARGNKYGPDVIQITTEGLETYIFEKPPRGGSFPAGLKKLLESDAIKKVAASISADRTKLAEAGIKLAGEINLQTMAKERGVVETATVGLAAIFKKLFDGIELEKDEHIRISQWDKRPLTDEQVSYAALDSYSQMLCYLKMSAMDHVDAKLTKAPTVSELRQGSRVLLYTRNLSAVVADGIFIGPAQIPNQIFPGRFGTDKKFMVVRVENIRRPGAKIERNGNKSFDEVCREQSSTSCDNDADRDRDEDTLVVQWPIAAMRPLPDDKPSASFNVSIQWREQALPEEQGYSNNDDEDILAAEANPPDGTSLIGDDGDCDNDNNDADESENNTCDRPSNDPLHVHQKSPYFLWTSGHTKQDIEHIFIRFSKVLSKQHGAFGPFMSRLSDAFFVPNQGDIEFVKEALRIAGLSEDEINSKRWRFFKRRIRRGVPGPVELEKQFNRVVNLMANIEDNKTGKPLFGKKAWNLYKATLLHIRKGCLSDIPELSYYVQVAEDSMGIPIFRCLRGTSALEGFHQKVRQLIRGFNISPRFAIALLYEFIHRWNHDVDIRILGLPGRYANYYDGWDIEEEIEAACSWDELKEPPHPDIECTKHFAATGEDFGIVGDLLEGDGSEEHLDGEIEKILDSVKDGSWTTSEFDDAESTVFQSLQGLTSSAAWVAEKYGRKRGAKQIKTSTEKDFFCQHLASFQHFKGSNKEEETSEADNYTSIQWGRFARFWNNWVKDEDLGKRPTTDMTYKNQFMLMAYYKRWKQEGNAAATLLPIAQANKELRRELRGPSRETSVVFEKEAPRIEKRIPRRGTKRVHVDVGGPIGDGEGVCDGEPPLKKVAVQNFTGTAPRGIDVALCVEAPVAAKQRRSRKPNRCRMCGHTKRSEDFLQHHERPLFKRMSPYTITKMEPHTVCTMPESKRKKHFPVPEGVSMDSIPRDDSDVDN